MGAPFVTLFGLLLLLSYPTGVEPLRFAGGAAAPAAALGVVLVFGILCRRTAAARPGFVGRSVLQILAVLLYGLLVFVFHWPLWTWWPWVEASPLLQTLLGLAPLYALLGIQGVTLLPQGRRGFAFRAFLGLAFLPLLGILLLQEILERITVFREALFLLPSLGGAAVLGTLLPASFLLPRLLRFVFAARPVPAGELRDRLESRCRAMGFPPAGLYVIASGATANAFVAGLLARRRPVFFTGSLLQGMTPEEVEAVLAHEVTHAQRRHLEVYLMLALSFGVLSGGLYQALQSQPGWMVLAGMLTAAFIFWVGLFSFLSRGFESEADLGAAKGPGGYPGSPEMVRALLRVGELNGSPPEAGSLRHFSIARRVAILQEAYDFPGHGEEFERTCRRRRGAIAVGFGVCLLLAFGMALEEARGIPDRIPLLQGIRTAERGRELLEASQHEEALKCLRGAVAAGVEDATLWLWIARAEQALGRESAARDARAQARRRGLIDPRDRLEDRR